MDDPEVIPAVLERTSPPAPQDWGLVRRLPKDVVLMPVMDTRLAKQRLEELQSFCANYLQESTDGGEDGGDYGVIPGTKRKTLLKSGAEKLCDIYGLADEYRILAKVEDFEHGLFDYTIECRLLRKTDEMFVGSGLGSCSSFESRYRWRMGQRACPECGQETIIKGKAEYGGGWVCWKTKGGCGEKFLATDPRIVGQAVGRMENPDIIDSKNTVLKMAKKRAKVDAVIAATRSSGIFTQDLDDHIRAEEPMPVDPAAPPVMSKSVEKRVETQKAAATAVPKATAAPEGETHAQKIARQKAEAAQRTQAAPPPAQTAPPPEVTTPAEAPVPPPVPAPAATPSVAGPDGAVQITGINVRNGPMVMKDGVAKPSWGPLYVIGFSHKVKASDGTLVADATTFDEKIANTAADLRDAATEMSSGWTMPLVEPGKKKGSFNIVGFEFANAE